MPAFYSYQSLHPEVYERVATWIPEGSRVLDLGSGDGEFLAKLVSGKNIEGEGVEKNPEYVARCIERGLVVHQGDILDGLDQYDNDSFDYVLLLGTFEELEDPERVLQEAFRVGKKLIIAYHNFAYWRVAAQILFYGKAPVTQAMPHQWYDTPTVHFFSILDFREFCIRLSFHEIRAAYFNSEREVKIAPRLRAEYGMAMIEQG